MADSQIQRWWYTNSFYCYFLLPLTWLFQSLSVVRRFYWQKIKKPTLNSVPVIVVGNISVGGTGKTPLIISMVNHFQSLGLKSGVISRGYGSRAPKYPYSVTAQSPVKESGDEALLIAKSTRCPVSIGPNRPQALKALLELNHCDVVLSDDGLQHYALARDIEIAVIDGDRGLANGFCLPAGPLRESSARLREVDWIVVNGPLKNTRGIPENVQKMSLKTAAWRRVCDDSEATMEELSHIDGIHALTGIGNPQRFFRTLQAMNLAFEQHSFDDHHDFQLSDILFNDDLPVVMTEKDAVKCRVLLNCSTLDDFRRHSYWYVPVQAQVGEEFLKNLTDQLKL